MPIVGATEDFDKPAPIVMRPEDPDKIDSAPAIVTFMTTEHFVLQTARAATIAETNGRTALFLGSVSSVLVALAFFGQVSKLGPAFFVFGLVLLPALFFVGLVTFERAIRRRLKISPTIGASRESGVSILKSLPVWSGILPAPEAIVGRA
jgi:hypothetical protein